MVIDTETGALKLNGAARRKLRNARIMGRDGHQCRICGATNRLTVQHIRPKPIGGSGRDDNLVTVCSVCHHGMMQLGGWLAQQLASWMLWPVNAVLVRVGRARSAR